MTEGKVSENTNSEHSSLNINDFDQWMHYFRKLVNNNTIIPNEDATYSAEVGSFGWDIGKNTIIKLRENNTDSEGNIKYIFVDEVTDSELISESSKEKIKPALLDSIFKNSYRHWMATDQKKADAYIASALTLIQVLLDEGFEESKNTLNSFFEEKTFAEKENLTNSLQNISKEKVKNVVDYLQFSQTQMSEEEERQLLSGFKEQKEIGSEPIKIDGNTYKFDVEQSEPLELNINDYEIVQELNKATRRGRVEMQLKALSTAKEIFDIKGKNIEGMHPPSWWLQDDSLEGLYSNDFLFFVPYSISDQEKVKTIPSFMQKALDYYHSGGWFIAQIAKEDPRYILEINRLTN